MIWSIVKEGATVCGISVSNSDSIRRGWGREGAGEKGCVSPARSRNIYRCGPLLVHRPVAMSVRCVSPFVASDDVDCAAQSRSAAVVEDCCAAQQRTWAVRSASVVAERCSEARERTAVRQRFAAVVEDCCAAQGRTWAVLSAFVVVKRCSAAQGMSVVQ